MSEMIRHKYTWRTNGLVRDRFIRGWSVTAFHAVMECEVSSNPIHQLDDSFDLPGKTAKPKPGG
jgi:hypothetical protein